MGVSVDIVTQGSVGFIKLAFRKYLVARADEAREILLEELAAGKKTFEEIA